jgi:uncharacterized damage-inducible protein DinB
MTVGITSEPAMTQPLFEHLHDLHRHMAWADAIWFHVWAKAGLGEDEDLLKRMRHSIDVQDAFLTLIAGGEVTWPDHRLPPDYDFLRTLCRANHDAFEATFARLTPEDLATTITVPWFPGKPCVISIADALTQVAMHSQHHRAQQMTKLKDLGGTPQNVDYIIWVWKDKPEGRWS